MNWQQMEVERLSKITPFEKFKELNHKHAYILLEWNNKLPVKFALYELTENNLYALLAMAGIKQDS